MTGIRDDLPVMEFKNGVELCEWLTQNHSTSPGIWLRVFNKRSKVASVTFEELLDEGLCFGWSESMRRTYDDVSYLQRFTPRKTRGTASKRNLDRVDQLVHSGRMTDYGLLALGMKGLQPILDKHQHK
jgi:uncharacterized protein YdeI (YjbR/CyaY-like superfamily)